MSAKFTTMYKDPINKLKIDHELVENMPNAARIGYKSTEIRDDS